MRYLRLYFTFFAIRMKMYAEHRAAVALLALSAVASDGVAIAFVWIVYEQVPEIAGWSRSDVLLAYALLTLSGGIGQLFIDGCWTIGHSVHEGRFELFLTRPVPALVSVLTTWMSPEGIGTIALGTVLLALAVPGLDEGLSVGVWATGGLLFCCGVAVRTGWTLLINCLAFWSSGAVTLGVSQVTEPMYDFARFPLSIYVPAVRVALLTVIPLGFISAVPASFIVGERLPAVVYLASPLVALGVWAAALAALSGGSSRYEGVGN
jgi:ABC-2 type transport system permease protein